MIIPAETKISAASPVRLMASDASCRKITDISTPKIGFMKPRIVTVLTGLYLRSRLHTVYAPAEMVLRCRHLFNLEELLFKECVPIWQITKKNVIISLADDFR